MDDTLKMIINKCVGAGHSLIRELIFCDMMMEIKLKKEDIHVQKNAYPVRFNSNSNGVLNYKWLGTGR